MNEGEDDAACSEISRNSEDLTSDKNIMAPRKRPRIGSRTAKLLQFALQEKERQKIEDIHYERAMRDTFYEDLTDRPTSSATDNLIAVSEQNVGATLLSGTLRTYQKAACDEDSVSLKCPRGTSITIQVAQYGKSAPSSACAAELQQYNPVAVEVVGNTSCMWPNALQTVVEACQKKRQCKFLTSPKTFGGDPCPGARKFVEVAYKCRPYEFRSKVGCEGDVLQLSCNPHSRIAIYSASYGRTEYESIQCPQPQGVPEETCLVSYATETVMHICHGKRRCVLTADSSTFGAPCKPDSRTYLKVVYTCVPRKVLKERYEGPPEEDELPSPLAPHPPNTDNDDFYDTEPGEEHYPAAIPPAPKVAVEPPSAPAQPTDPARRAPLPPPVSDSPRRARVDPAVHEHSDPAGGDGWSGNSVYVYAGASAGAVAAACACATVARCVVRRRRSRPPPPDLSANTELPNGFTDSISEVDNDIDIGHVSGSLDKSARIQFTELAPKPTGAALYAGRPVPNTYPHAHVHAAVPEMYGAPGLVGTLRRGGALPLQQLPQADVVVSPRSLSRYSNAQYYYG